MLGGCSNFDTSGSWFARPLDLFGNRTAYTYANLDDPRQAHVITQNDLVDASGACPNAAAPRVPAADNPAGGPDADAASVLGGGIAIGMSECDVVGRLGQASAVNLGRTPNGDRSAILTFTAGPRPGIYRFAGGRLTEMDRVQEPPPPPPEPEKKKTAKKKPPKPPPKPDDKS